MPPRAAAFAPPTAPDSTSEYFLAEAGTATGKTLRYIRARQRLVRKDAGVWISTIPATCNKQIRSNRHLIPIGREGAPGGDPKGRENYLCCSTSKTWGRFTSRSGGMLSAWR